MSAGFQLAQINVARLNAPLDSPEVADFRNGIDVMNTTKMVAASDAPNHRIAKIAQIAELTVFMIGSSGSKKDEITSVADQVAYCRKVDSK